MLKEDIFVREDEVDENNSDKILKRALIEPGSGVSVAMRVTGLALSDGLTVVFHGRRDLATVQTYVAQGKRKAGSTVLSDELLRVPCDLDLAQAQDRDEAEELYARQAAALRDAIVGADTVLAVWQEPLADLLGSSVDVDHRVDLNVKFPAHRLMPCALNAEEKHIIVTPVCGSRPLAEGRPPLGIACAQQDFARVYPLSDDPERCLEDFLSAASEHARNFSERLRHQEASVKHFLELSGEDFTQAS